MIKVIIERKIAEGLEPNYLQAARDTLKAVLEAPGYISSESLIDVNDPNHNLIITNWTSIEAWNLWYTSEERKKVIAQIAPILLKEEKITITQTR